MTLGNDPQPLTRRQLRELARENEPASSETDPSVDPASLTPAVQHSRHTAPGIEAPAAAKLVPARPASAKPASAKPASAKPKVVEPEAATPVPAPLPLPDAPAAARTEVTESVVVQPGHTLTRRELRALQAAAAASAEPAAGVTPANGAGAQDAEPVSPVGVTPAETNAAQTDSAHTNSAHTNSAQATPAQKSPAAAAPLGLNLPVGHWSVDREDDSHIQSIGRRDDTTFDDLVGSGMGAGGIPTTTNALILPAIPRQGTAGPITSTGEIMITGSIDLPRSLGATGQHPNLFDSSEMDRMLDQLDEGGHHNDVAPVSASRAVSTHTSTRGVMTPPRKRGASLPTVLAITAAVLAIGVLSLFVVGYAFNIY